MQKSVITRPEIKTVTFLICTHDRGNDRLPLLKQCIVGVRNQTPVPGVSLEIVLCDNGTRQNEDVLRAICPEAHYVYEPKRGYSNARNSALQTGLNNTTAELFIFIDDDVLPGSNVVENCLATIHSFHADVAGGGVSKTADQRIKKVATSCVSFRRWIAETITFCPEANLLGHEDHEFFADAKRAGAKMVACPGAQAVESPQPNRPKEAHRLAGVSARNHIRIARQRHGLGIALCTYLHLYAVRGVRAVVLTVSALLLRDENMRGLAQKNAVMHRGAVEGFYRPGLDREQAKHGRCVEVR